MKGAISLRYVPVFETLLVDLKIEIVEQAFDLIDIVFGSRQAMPAAWPSSAIIFYYRRFDCRRLEWKPLALSVAFDDVHGIDGIASLFRRQSLMRAFQRSGLRISVFRISSHLSPFQPLGLPKTEDGNCWASGRHASKLPALK